MNIPDTVRWDPCDHDVDDDCKAEFCGYLLRAEVMQEDWVWWAVYGPYPSVNLRDTGKETTMTEARSQATHHAAERYRKEDR